MYKQTNPFIGIHLVRSYYNLCKIVYHVKFHISFPAKKSYIFILKIGRGHLYVLDSNNAIVDKHTNYIEFMET
jgi:hypothetical protein